MRKTVGEFFVVYYKPDTHTQISVVVPKKIEKSSVERHYLKRKVYSICKSHVDMFNGTFIIFPTKSVKNIKFDILEKSLLTLISK